MTDMHLDTFCDAGNRGFLDSDNPVMRLRQIGANQRA